MAGEYTRALQDLHVKLNRVLENQRSLARMAQLTWKAHGAQSWVVAEREADREEVNDLVKRILK
jgi:hypothetical protein